MRLFLLSVVFVTVPSLFVLAVLGSWRATLSYIKVWCTVVGAFLLVGAVLGLFLA